MVTARFLCRGRRLPRRTAPGRVPLPHRDRLALDLDLLSLSRRLERRLAPFAAPGTPGCAMGILRGGDLVLHRQAGLASLELGVPIGPETCFRIASVTKQFTCAAILLLAGDGRLSPEDDVHLHLPELPDFGVRITLDHLMRNCSGLRDMLELSRLGGMDLAQPCTSAQLLAAICRQRTLNFAPGSRFLYCNSGFFLLGLVIERVGGEPLAAFLERRIFAPLGMTRTRMVGGTEGVVPGLATGYLPAAGGFVRAAHGFALGGEGGMVSCVEDLALWARNFATGRVGGAALAASLQDRRPFTNGALNRYARGLEAGEHRGLATMDHGGLWPGFKTCFMRVPALDLAIIAISNHGGADPHLLAHQVLDDVAEGAPGLLPAPPLPSRAALDALSGRWVEDGTGATLDLSVAEDGTPMARSHGVPFALSPTADGRLTARRGVFCFTLRPDGDALEVEADAGIRTTWRRAPATTELPPGLEGRYACPELAAEWRIALAGGQAQVTVHGPVVKAGPWRAEPVAPGILRIHVPGVLFESWYDLRVEPAGGFLVSGARARDLRFDRIA